MSHFHRQPVVVPIDFSPSSMHAVFVAKSIAESDQDLTVVYVTHDYDLIVPAHTWGGNELPERNDEQQMVRLRDWAKDNNFGNVKLVVRTGDPGTEVCKLAEEISCKLIVLPSHGHHGVKRVLLGSVAERIIRHCECSVLVLRRESIVDQGAMLAIAEHWFPRKHVVVPVDFSNSTIHAIDTALEVTDDRTSIDILSVVPTLNDAILMGEQVESDEDRRKNRQQYLERYLVEHGYSVLQAHVVTGDTGMMIARYASDVKADLIVMPSHGRHGLHRMVLGSTTERVIRHAETPVLVLRRHDAE